MMRCHPIVLLAGLLTVVRAQGVPRTFSARPYRGGPPLSVRAVLGGTAELPCDIRPPHRNDSAILVVWYKSDVIPIYSYDLRGKHSEKASHWQDKEYLNDRAFFRTTTEPATLNVNHIQDQDEGEFRCRVDFTTSPTRNSRIQLTVIEVLQLDAISRSVSDNIFTSGLSHLHGIVTDGLTRRVHVNPVYFLSGSPLQFVSCSDTCLCVKGNYKVERLHFNSIYTQVPPQKPNIIDEQGNPVTTVAGPYEEGGDMRLYCYVFGGRPEPKVRWWRGETLLDSKDESGDSHDVRKNTLIVSELSRADLHAVFECQASNNNISQPVSMSVAIEMHLRPLSVTILSSEHAPLSANRKYDINCMTIGSRPPAELSWYMDGKRLDNYTNKVSQDGNMTTSILTFQPILLDHDKVITCRAENSKIQRGIAEDTWKLNVFFVPILHLQLGSNMNPDDIEEGDDVYFECKVRANPDAYKVVWKHNGHVIQNNAKNGIIVQQYGLALREVNRSQAGNYTCVASNVEGDGYSNIVELKIMYKPICVPDQKRIYGVAKHEDARVICRVEAFPPPESFRWAFNNTEEMVDVPQARYKNSTRHTQSVLTYRPVTEMDYGTVLCWASNTAGQQKNACIFHIIPAGKPEAPYNCTLTNQTTESLSVECTAGFDGGQPQHFLLEVFDQHTGILQANVTSRDNAAFTVKDLESGKVLNMILYAVNAKGRSDPTLLEGFTLKIAEKQTGTPVPFEFTPLLGGLIGVVTALLLLTVTILAALKVRSERRAQRPGDLPLKKATAPSSEDLYDADDRNPDVVPTNKDSDYQLTGSTSGTPLATQNTPDGLPPSSLPVQQTNNHLQGLPAYSHNDYSNYPTLPLSGEVTYAELCLARPTTLSTLATDAKLASLGGGVGGLGGLSGYGTGLGVIVGGKPYTKEATVYACIDHNARPPKIDVSNAPSCATTPLTTANVLQDSTVSTVMSGGKQHHPAREVVTVRTPLISTQESCV